MCKSRSLTRKQVIFIFANSLILIVVIILYITFGKLKSSLPSQQFADRWFDGEVYSQVSVFFTDSIQLELEGLNSMIQLFEKRQAESPALSSEGNVESLIYGFSSNSSLSVTREIVTVETAVTGVGENFFMFHPLQLLSGSYIYGSDLMRDRVVIDSNLAWQLFGATNVAGMEIEIGGLPYIIAGVVAPETNYSSTAASSDKPIIYMSYERLLLNDSSARITCLEILAPDPVNDFTTEAIKAVLEEQAIAEEDRDIINNTDRYSFTNLLGVIKDLNLRSIRPDYAPTYPYWENAARMVEDYLAVILIFIILLLVLFVVSLILLIVRFWRRRKWKTGE